MSEKIKPAPVGEPVGWLYELGADQKFYKVRQHYPGNWVEQMGYSITPLYASPVPAITDEMVEAGARAMANNDPTFRAWHEKTQVEQVIYRETAHAVLTAALRSSTVEGE